MFYMNTSVSVLIFCIFYNVFGDVTISESVNPTVANTTDVEVMTTTVSSNPTITTTSRVLKLRERSHSRHRRFRLQRIREHILRSLGWTEPPKIPEEVRRNFSWNNSFPMIQERVETREDRRCFSATCSLPRNIDRTLWNSQQLDGFRLYVNFSSMPALSRSDRLHSANLNIFLRHRPGFSCHGERLPVSTTAGSRFLVSVYQFVRPLRLQRNRNRVINRKRLIDARMVTPSGQEWVSLDVRQAVTEWTSGGRNNFGFEIMIKDENENACNVLDMIVPADCNSPPETGCREDNSMTGHIRSQWPHDRMEENYPYVELVVRQRLTSRTRVRTRQRRGFPLGYVEPRDLTKKCIERRVELSLNNVIITVGNEALRVIFPKSYSTLICDKGCDAKEKDSPLCQLTRSVIGILKDSTGRLRFGDLPMKKVIRCSC